MPDNITGGKFGPETFDDCMLTFLCECLKGKNKKTAVCNILEKYFIKKKRLQGNSLLDKLHRGAVYTCLGVTLYGTFLLGMRAYRYYTVVKPDREKAEFQKITEGSHDNAKELKC